ncbi:hypothetical protein OJAV_G00109810 [Oryzias javanicus]|uniref:Uncharacterized protein n=1 Tax=Oryzias javanicus TaxID=123683 RepID=A0A3S2P7V9_ORYJA|nr:hypothetical protein OJAV_G00109810 [Oryzias javanicus]
MIGRINSIKMISLPRFLYKENAGISRMHLQKTWDQRGARPTSLQTALLPGCQSLGSLTLAAPVAQDGGKFCQARVRRQLGFVPLFVEITSPRRGHWSGPQCR